MPLWMQENGRSVVFKVRVQPRAARNEIIGVWGDAVKVRLTAPPVEGQANRALVHFLAEVLDVSPGNVSVVAGAAGRDKKVSVTGRTAAEVLRRLQACCKAPMC